MARRSRVSDHPQSPPVDAGAPLWQGVVYRGQVKVSGLHGTFRLMGVREEKGGVVLSVFGPEGNSGMWRSFREADVTPVRSRRGRK